ncbi:response regulator [bacterium]|nr:response regulator [bacterium]
MHDNLIKVLLVDDDKSEYFLIKEMISDFELVNVHLDWEHDVNKAQLIMKEHDHHVYLVDYKLGPVTGLELIQSVQDPSLFNNSIYILLTGFSNLQVEQEAMVNGVDDYLSKNDVNAAILERAIRYGLERKKNLIELKKSRNQYKQIYLNTKTSVIEVDLDFNVMKINNAFKETFKYSDDFDLGRLNEPIKVWDLLDCFNLKEHVVKHILDKNAKNASIFECKDQEGNLLKVQLNVYELVSASERYSYQIVIIDLTEKVKHDEEVNQKQKLDLMEKMARIVAHEVRNPLTNIILSSEQLKAAIEEKDAIYPEIIIRNSNKIEDLIGKFLNTFKQIDIQMEPTDVSDMLESCISDFQDKAKLMEVGIDLCMEDELPPVCLDREKIELVIHNLLSNAIDACSKDGSGIVQVSAQNSNDFLFIKVKDNGVGIEEDVIEKLFQPFYTNKSNGLGLGLTTSANLIKSHEGDIIAENNSDFGACFTIKLPVTLQDSPC